MDHTIKRLNWGCGEGEKGWINADIKEGRGIDISCDIRKGLPLEDESVDYIASIHALQEVPYPDLVSTLQELHRVLKTRGVLRLCLPDLLQNIRAYERGDRDYFLVPDKDAEKIGTKLIVQLIWYGYSRTLFTSEFIEEVLLKAGFSRVSHCRFKETSSPFAEIVELDNRERESLFVEAVK